MRERARGWNEKERRREKTDVERGREKQINESNDMINSLSIPLFVDKQAVFR